MNDLYAILVTLYVAQWLTSLFALVATDGKGKRIKVWALVNLGTVIFGLVILGLVSVFMLISGRA